MPLDDYGSQWPAGHNYMADPHPPQQPKPGFPWDACYGFLCIAVIILIAKSAWDGLVWWWEVYLSPAKVEERRRRRHRQIEAAREAAVARALAQAEQEQRRRAQKEEQESARREQDRIRREQEDRRTAIPRLAKWYADQKAVIDAAVPPGLDRDELHRHLFDRYDQLLKDLLREMSP